LKLPKMYPKQAAIFNSTVKYNVIPKGRRSGFTMGAVLHLIKNCIIGNIKRALWVDVRHSNIDKYVEDWFYPILRQLPQSLWEYRQVKKQLVFKLDKKNDKKAIIDFGSMDSPQGLEGFGYQCIIINEAGHVLKNEALWYSTLLPMSMDFPDCQIFLGGTPRGKNLFHKLALRAEKTENWKLFKLTTYDNPHLNEEAVKETESQIAEIFRKQELEGIFLDDSGSVFRNISKCIKGELEDPIPGKKYKAGVDLARKLDYTAICVLNQNNHLCAYHRMHNIDWTIQKARIKQILEHYNNADALVDSSGLGDPIISDLEDMGLRVTPYQFTQKSKIQLIDQLSIGIEKEELSFPEIPELINELESYEFDQGPTNIKYGTQSEHDDIVIALALAYWQGTLGKPKPFKYFLHHARGSSLWRRRHEKTLFEIEREFKRTGEYKEEW